MMIAARESFAAAARRRWKNPYVADGLVAMWDGEWNAGGGVHDPNATVWKDLIGSDDMSFNLAPTVDADGFVYPNGGYSSSSIARTLNAYTIEICGDLRPKGATSNDVFSFQRKNATDSLYGVPYLIIYQNNPNYFYAPMSNVPTVYSTVALAVDNGTTGVSFAGGVRLPGNNSLNVADSVYVIANSLRTRTVNSKARKFHNIRLYSRALTAAEIAVNHAIDKERFNLP